MTREYEVVYIFNSALSSEDVESRLEKYHKKALAAEGAEITAVEHWGKRQLAYPIDGHLNGNYVVAQFSTGPEALPEFERGLKLDEEVLRYLVVLSEGELPTPPSARFEKDDRESQPEGERAAEAGDTKATAEAETEPEAETEATADDAEPEAEAEAEAEADEADIKVEAEAEADEADIKVEAEAEAEADDEDGETDTAADPVEAGAAEEE
ncbi:MAG: 30S ribosomal protein S6 [Gemmatimonadota bacterium]